MDACKNPCSPHSERRCALFQHAGAVRTCLMCSGVCMQRARRAYKLRIPLPPTVQSAPEWMPQTEGARSGRRFPSRWGAWRPRLRWARTENDLQCGGQATLDGWYGGCMRACVCVLHSILLHIHQTLPTMEPRSSTASTWARDRGVGDDEAVHALLQRHRGDVCLRRPVMAGGGAAVGTRGCPCLGTRSSSGRPGVCALGSPPPA